MRKIQRHTLERLLATLRLNKTQMEYNNTYVFGFDDVERIIISEIAAVSPLLEIGPFANCAVPHGINRGCDGEASKAIGEFLPSK